MAKKDETSEALPGEVLQPALIELPYKVQPGTTIQIRQDRHTDRTAHEAHLAAGGAPEESPAPMVSRYIPAIVFQVADDGTTVSAHVFHGARGIGFIPEVKLGEDVGQYRLIG